MGAIHADVSSCKNSRGTADGGSVDTPSTRAPRRRVHLDLGPDHPSQAGLVTISCCTCQDSRSQHDDRIAAGRMHIGHLHRGVEKLFEVRDYRQIPMLASRHDWHAPFIGEAGAAMAIEKALGIDAPPRAMHVRTILIEFSRMTSHLAFLSWLPWRVADFSHSGRVHHLLDTAHDLWEGFCGNRIHPMTCRIGGTAHDVTPVFAASLNTWCMHAAALSDELRSLLDGPAGACTRGVAVIPADAVAPFGLSGPVARASGVPMDLRCPNAARRRTSRSETTTSWRAEDSRDAPRHLAYDQVNFPVVDAPTEGDAHSRLSWLCAEVRQSADLVTTLLQSLPDGELATRLPTTLKVPAGRVWSRLEAPWGRAGYLLDSRGTTSPWRLALRTPTFANVQVLEHLLPTLSVEQLEPAVASLGWTLGDLDK